MNWLAIFILFCYATLVVAEHTETKNEVYNEASQLTVGNINQAIEVLRNPTIMSGNFRQALANLKPGISTAAASTLGLSDAEEHDMPFIELVAKVLAPDKPSTVVLRVNDHSMYLTEGSTASQMVNRKIINIRVDKITANDVTIFLSPFDQVMVLQ